jgi:hypothetical protein
MSDRRRAALLDGALSGMFRALEARPLPEHVLRTVALLEESRTAAARPPALSL